jgi:hypothetical protein
MHGVTRAITRSALLLLVTAAGCGRACASTDATDRDGAAASSSDRASPDAPSSHPPVEPWLARLGGEGEDEGLAVATGPDGTVAVTGVFSGVVEPDGIDGAEPWRSGGGSDAFVAVWSSDGRLRWTRTLGGGGEDRGHAVTVASDGSVVVAGRFQGAAEIGDGAADVGRLRGTGSSDAFVLSLDRDGAVRWSRTIGGSGWAEALALREAPGGGVLVGGRFAGTVDLDPTEGTDQRTAAGDVDGFAVMLTSDGGRVWSRVVGGAGLDEVLTVDVDASGSVLAGCFSDVVDLDADGVEEPRRASGFTDVFVVRLGPDGALRWARTWGGAYVDQANGVALASGGEVAVTGIFVDAVSFDPAAEDGERRSVGRSDVFVAALSADGSLRWVRTLGGPSSDYGTGLAVGPAGEVVVTGRFQGTASIVAGEGRVDLTSSGHRPDGFVAAVDRDGRSPWAASIGGPGLDRCRAVAVGAGGVVVVTGAFEDTLEVRMGDDAPRRTTSRGAADVFVFRWLDTLRHAR